MLKNIQNIKNKQINILNKVTLEHNKTNVLFSSHIVNWNCCKMKYFYQLDFGRGHFFKEICLILTLQIKIHVRE